MKVFLNKDELLKAEYKFNTPKIDWLNFTIKDELNREQQVEEVQKIVTLIFKEFNIAFEATDSIGNCYDDLSNCIRIEAKHNRRTVQLKGAFFTLTYGRSLDIAKKLFILLNEYEQERTTAPRVISRWKVGRIDTAIDLLGYKEVGEVLPVPSETYKQLIDPKNSKGYFKGFKSGLLIPYEDKKTPNTFTGWKMYWDKRELTVYSKTVENKIAKNKKKTHAYDLLFRTFETIFRVELKEKTAQGSLRATERFQKLIIDGEDFEEIELCQSILKSFYRNHRMYLNDYEYEGKNKKHLEEERWEKLFNTGLELAKLDYVEFKEHKPIETFSKHFKTAYKAQIWGEISEKEIEAEMKRIMLEIRSEKERLEHYDGAKPKAEHEK